MYKIPIDEIFYSSNEEIIPISEMEDRNQKVVYLMIMYVKRIKMI